MAELNEESAKAVDGSRTSLVTERTLHEQAALLRGQMQAFEAALNGQPISASLGVLARTARCLVGADAGAGFYEIREDRRSLRHLVGMSESYAQIVDGFPVGPDSFCSGLAAHTGQPVFTRDVDLDPRWATFRTVAHEHGFRACWSIPIQVPSGPILGTMALYFANPREPSEHEAGLMANLTRAAAIILSRHAEMAHRAEAERSLREADRRKDEFLAILSHELRNPLAPMRSALELLRRTEQLSTSGVQWLATLSRQMEQMVRLLDDLLDVSRVSQGKIELKRQSVDLGALLHEAVDSIRLLAEHAEQHIVLDTVNDPVLVDADPVRILQVFGNLLSNACRYSERGGRTQCTLRREDDEAVVAIRDSGIGIPTDELEGIFELFAQVDRTLERSRGGLGIGLHLTKQFVHMHGGTVQAHSAGLGEGSEFVVRLPISEHVPRPAPSANADVDVERPKPLSRRILIVDDNVDSAQSLSILLKLYGNETATAFDGDAAIAAALRDRPDVILLDIGMPNRNGLDVCRTLRRQLADDKPIIVALSGYGTDKDRANSAEAGFDAHLVKPVHVDTLQLVLRDLGSTQSSRES